MKEKSCVVCGFDKKVENHHIIKWKELGSDEESNLVYLCPNHHWIADFGEEQDREEILKIIKKITGKIGTKINIKEENILDLKIRLLQEGIFKEAVWDNNWWDDFKETSNYLSSRNWLRGRGCPQDWTIKLNEKADKLLLIKKIKESIPLIE